VNPVLAGYFVRLFYISTLDPRINAARVADRVMQGGHTVPIDKIVTRYARSMANLGAAIELADRVYIYDNSVDNRDALLVARAQDGLLRKIYGALPEWVRRAVERLPLHQEFVDDRRLTHP
jgi:predicted ABC-type ATPase